MLQLNLSILFMSIVEKLFFQKVEQPTTSGGKEVFHKKPLGRRRHLANSPKGLCA